MKNLPNHSTNFACKTFLAFLGNVKVVEKIITSFYQFICVDYSIDAKNSIQFKF